MLKAVVSFRLKEYHNKVRFCRIFNPFTVKVIEDFRIDIKVMQYRRNSNSQCCCSTETEKRSSYKAQK